jgi:hypothetical protein
VDGSDLICLFWKLYSRFLRHHVTLLMGNYSL